MKKILLLLLFSFSVIAYAAPPPLLTDIVADEVQYIVQDEVQTINATAQEVAYVYTGDTLLYSCQITMIEPVAKLEFPDLVVMNNYYAQIDELNQPPANMNYAERLTDKQHSNYGYPLSAN